MSWIVLVASGVLEAVWATALGRSAGFTRLWPTVVFALSLVASMAGLAYAMRSLPIGTAYAVWVGIGAALTVAIAPVLLAIGAIAAVVSQVTLVVERRADAAGSVDSAAPASEAAPTSDDYPSI